MYKLKLLLLPVAWLLAFMALACAPPDDDDRSSGPSSGPSINNAIYDFATALLTVQGSNLSPTEAQIQTIVVDGVALSSYTADDPATGPDSSGLAKGKYRIATDGTKLWLKLKDEHKAALEAKVGSNGLKKGLLSVSSGAWAGLNTPRDLVFKYIPEQAEEDEQDEQAEEESPKQPKAEDQSPKQPKAEDQSPKQAEDKQLSKQTEAEEAAITSASYDVGMALLTLQGTHLSATTATQAQIQTIVVDGLALSSYIADATATGPDSRGLAKGKYRLHSAGTALWLYLTDQHKATLNGKTGMDSNGLKKGLLTSSGAWAGLDTAKDLEVRNIPENKQSKVSDDNQPSKQTEDEQAEEDEQVEQAEEESPEAAITSASYHVGMALLTLQGTHLSATTATQAQIQTIVVDGLALSSYIADATATGPDSRGLAKGKYRLHSAGTALWLYLTDQHKATLNGKTGMDSNGLKDGLLSVGTGAWAGLNTAKALAVSGNPPTITRATYNAATGVLVITGVNLPKTVKGWDFTKLRLVAGNGRTKSAPLLRHNPTFGFSRAKGSRASATSLTITLKGTEKGKADSILVKNGDSDADGFYNLEAAAGFAGGSAEDTSNNPITVSGRVSHITNAIYNVGTGVLTINGTDLPTTVADWDFSKLTLVSGDGKKRYTLPQHATVGENTATGSAASITSVTITLSGSVKAEANKILVKAGFQDADGYYNLEGAAGFVMGSPADTTTNYIIVGNL